MATRRFTAGVGAVLSAGFLGAFLMASPAFVAEPSALATIEASATDGGVRLVGHVLALAPGDYDAKMTIEKSGASGRTSTTQGGAVSLKAGERAAVATVGLSMAPGDRLAVDLVLSAGGQEVARSMMSVGK